MRRALALLGLILGGCVAPASPTPTAAPSAQPTAIGKPSPAAASSGQWEHLLAAGRKEGTVVVIGPPFPELRQSLTDQFTKDTGIQLEYVALSTAEGPARAEREATAGRVSMDVLVGGGSELLTLLPKGYLEPVAPLLTMPEVADRSKWDGGDLAWVDQERQYMLRTASTVYGGLLVNTQRVPAGTIKTWQDLLAPEWHGKIIAFDPRSSGPGRGAASNLLYRLGPDYLRQLFVGQQVTYSREERGVVEAVARGSSVMAIGAALSQVEQFRKEGLPLGIVFPDGAPGYLSGGYSVVKVLKSSPHPNAAGVFVNWFAGRTAQDLYSRIVLEASRRTDVDRSTIPDYIVPRPGVDYLDQYAYQWYTQHRKATESKVDEILGR
jgi:iron(III) transport system substrate-binding protein